MKILHCLFIATLFQVISMSQTKEEELFDFDETPLKIQLHDGKDEGVIMIEFINKSNTEVIMLDMFSPIGAFFDITFTRDDGSIYSISAVKIEFYGEFSYFSLASDESRFVDLDIREHLHDKEPVSISLAYRNFYGENCFKGFVAAENILSLHDKHLGVSDAQVYAGGYIKEISYDELIRRYKESRYSIKNNKLHHDNSESEGDIKIRNIINRTIQHLGEGVYIEGAKVVVLEKDSVYEVYFDSQIPEGALGTEYAAKVTIDKNSNEVLSVLVGS